MSNFNTAWEALTLITDEINATQTRLAQLNQVKTIQLQKIIDEHHPMQAGDIAFTDQGLAFTVDMATMLIKGDKLYWRATGQSDCGKWTLESLREVVR